MTIVSTLQELVSKHKNNVILIASVLGIVTFVMLVRRNTAAAQVAAGTGGSSLGGTQPVTSTTAGGFDYSGLLATIGQLNDTIKATPSPGASIDISFGSDNSSTFNQYASSGKQNKTGTSGITLPGIGSLSLGGGSSSSSATGLYSDANSDVFNSHISGANLSSDEIAALLATVGAQQGTYAQRSAQELAMEALRAQDAQTSLGPYTFKNPPKPPPLPRK